jgi:RNA polymerase sigma factor (sigma-70 family)
MQKLWLVSSKVSHEEVFLQRYDRLLDQALHITDRSYSAAEDLVHDAFIQFTLSQPDLAVIKDLDSYLFIVLRNMHLSQVRRASQLRFAPISIADYDSAAIGLRAIDLQKHIQVAEELIKICDYACSRKESSKAASVLILRFFHGYFTSEIAEMIRAPRRTVHEWLRIARNEVKAFLENPKAFTFIGESGESQSTQTSRNLNDSKLLGELRERIFASRRGACPSYNVLQQHYNEDEGTTLQCKTLAHIVSCPTCLDDVNRMRRLPPLSDRYPTDMLGPDTRSHSGGNEMSRVTRAGDSTRELLKRCRRRLGEVLDHQPQALSFSANGFILGSQKVNSEITEQILSINIDEEISFVEVFSEQGMRLMFMGVIPSSLGGVEQKARLMLNERRDLECVISFRTPWPTLHVTYRDLSPRQESLMTSETFETESLESIREERSQEIVVEEATRGLGLLSFVAWLRKGLVSFAFWLRPAMITTVAALLLVAMLAVWYWRSPERPITISATGLLQRASATEVAVAAENGTVTHRTINLEETSATGELITRNRIEIWQSADRGIMVRRLYNEKGNLIAGDWRRADGVQTLYQHGREPRIQLAPGKRETAPLSFEEVWQLSPSAEDFSRLVGGAYIKVDEGPTAIRLLYERPTGTFKGQRLVNASLTLNRSDLHATGQTLLVQTGTELREFRFQEARFEKHTLTSAPPAVFEPDSVLLGEKRKDAAPAKNVLEPVLTLETLRPVIATPQLEIEVLKLLNQVGADTGEQVFVRRASSGLLQVDGVVDTLERKKEILQALAPVSSNPAFRARVETIDERVAREAGAGPAREPVTIEKIEPTSNSIPLESELRLYFSAQGVPATQLDSEVQRFCRTVLGHSSQILQHAGSLMNLTGRFTPDELRSLDSEARAKWLNLIHRHAHALRQNVVLLRRELGSVLAQSPSDAFAEEAIRDDVMLSQAINRLFNSASAIDITVRSSLSLSTNTSQAAKIKGAQFWRSLGTAEDIAANLSSTR